MTRREEPKDMQFADFKAVHMNILILSSEAGHRIDLDNPTGVKYTDICGVEKWLSH